MDTGFLFPPIWREELCCRLVDDFPSMDGCATELLLFGIWWNWTVDKCCSPVKKLFEFGNNGEPLTERFWKRCAAQVAQQRGSKISWNSVDADQPPSFFDYAFQYASRSSFSSDVASNVPTMMSNGSAAPQS
ncbi:hypothetical protein FI667_g7273, partial [Globisporangium splendens]